MADLWVLPDKEDPLLYPPFPLENHPQSVTTVTDAIEKVAEHLAQRDDLCLHWVGEPNTFPLGSEELRGRVHLYLDRHPCNPGRAARLAERIHVPSYYLKEKLERVDIFHPGQIALLEPLPADRPHRWQPAGATMRRDLREKKNWRGRKVILAIKESLTPLETFRLRRIMNRLKKGAFPELLFSLEPMRSVFEWLPGIEAVFVGGATDQCFSPFLLEAMAAGIPLLAIDAGDRREWVLHGHTGLLLSKKETGPQWVQSISLFLRNGALRRSLGLNGRFIFQWHRSRWKTSEGKGGT
ncbi:glycosyltransferase [Salinithrix halophila]|uniref:Glycosyltransferase n=1 Tax=Salinithrix halophila TaxID=1485204 RepID=A0ABV8JHH2_9BACL